MPNTVADKTKALTALLESQLGAGGKSFEQALCRAGRRLPRRLRARGRMLVEAEGHAAHPRLMQRVDMAEVEAAVAEFKSYLDAIDPAEERKTRLLNLAAMLAFQLLVIIVAVIIVLRWRGLV